MRVLIDEDQDGVGADEDEDGDSADEDEDGVDEIKGDHPASGGSAATSHACKLILLQCDPKTICRLVCMYSYR